MRSIIVCGRRKNNFMLGIVVHNADALAAEPLQLLLISSRALVLVALA
jgi:hypothetical protein